MYMIDETLFISVQIIRVRISTLVFANINSLFGNTYPSNQ